MNRNPWGNTLDVRVTGLGGKNPFAPNNSPSRGMLELSQTKTSVPLVKPELPLIASGYGVELLKGNMGISLPAGAKIIKILEYKVGDKLLETTVIYYHPDRDEICREVIKPYGKNDKTFGYQNRYTADFENLKEGEELQDDVKLTITNSEVDGEEAIGTNLNAAWIPHPGCAEDAMIISKSAAKKMEYPAYQTFTLEYTDNKIPLNAHGAIDDYKIFPDVGEYVDNDGILFATRKFSKDNFLSKFSAEACMEIDEAFDSVYRIRCAINDPDTGEPRVKVIDVQPHYAGDRKLGTLGKGLHGTYNQIERYYKAYLRYINGIIEAVEEIERDYDIRIGNQLHVDYVNAKLSTYSRPKKTWNREPIGIWRVDITVEYIMRPNVKSKITTLHGHKGIIVEVRPDEEMPVDENGTRADVIIDPLGIPARMNMGNPLEGYLTHNVIVNQRRVNEMIDSDASMEEIDEYVAGYLDLWDNGQMEIYLNASTEGRLEYARNLRIILTVENRKIPYLIAKDIMESKYATTVNKFWIHDNGERKLVKSPIAMQTNYMLLLYKTGDNWLAANATYINKLGIPVAASKNKKKMLPYNFTPLKLSISEGRMYPAFAGREAMAELRDRSTNYESQQAIIRSILEADEPMKIKRHIDRDKHPFGGDNVLTALKALTNSFGEKIIHVKEGDYEDQDS